MQSSTSKLSLTTIIFFKFLLAANFYTSEDDEIPEVDGLPIDENSYIGWFLDDGGSTTVGTIRADDGFIYCYGHPPQERYQYLCIPPPNCKESPCLHNEDWESVELQDPLPSDAVQLGHCSGGRAIYVARMSCISGDVIPAVAAVDQLLRIGKILAPWKRVDSADCGMILTGVGYSWQAYEEGNVPQCAVQVGVTANDEPLYIGRTISMGLTHPVKIHSSHHFCCAGWEGEDRQYEVLVMSDENNRHEWKILDCKEPLPADVVRAGPDSAVGRTIGMEFPIVVSIEPSTHQSMDLEYLCGTGFRWSKAYTDGNIPKDAVPAGYSQGHGMVYIGRVTYEGKVHVGGISTAKRCIFLIHEGQLISVADYEVLQHSWANGKQAVHRIETENTESLGFKGFKWIDCKQHDLLPENAVPVGWNREAAANCFVGRFWSDGEVLPAAVVVNEDGKINSARAAQNSKTIRSQLFQVLTGREFGWQPCLVNEKPSNAVTSGKTTTGEQLYIGRKISENCLLPIRIRQIADGRVLIGHVSNHKAYHIQFVELRDVELLTVRENDGE
jgi:Protein of unknown function (DUF3421)